MYLRGKVRFSQQTLTSGTTYNIFCVAAPANQRVAIEGIGVFGYANAAQTPGLVSMCTATSQGSTGTSLTPKSIDGDDSETFQSSWLSLPSTPPSSIAVIDDRGVNPQIGLEVYFPGQLAYMVKGGGFFVVQFTPAWTGSYSAWVMIGE